MDNFNLNAMGVKEMDSKELKQTDGGVFIEIIVGALSGLIYDIISDPATPGKSYIDGFNDGSNSKYNY